MIWPPPPDRTRTPALRPPLGAGQNPGAAVPRPSLPAHPLHSHENAWFANLRSLEPCVMYGNRIRRKPLHVPLFAPCRSGEVGVRRDLKRRNTSPLDSPPRSRWSIAPDATGTHPTTTLQFSRHP